MDSVRGVDTPVAAYFTGPVIEHFRLVPEAADFLELRETIPGLFHAQKRDIMDSMDEFMRRIRGFLSPWVCERLARNFAQFNELCGDTGELGDALIGEQTFGEWVDMIVNGSMKRHLPRSGTSERMIRGSVQIISLSLHVETSTQWY